MKVDTFLLFLALLLAILFIAGIIRALKNDISINSEKPGQQMKKDDDNDIEEE